eukprot:SAG11_NODE_25078_length_364_cov_0.584906_1_plen_111_part_01
MAQYLGITNNELRENPRLLHIAKEALQAELPPNWEEHIDSRETYYVDLTTGRRQAQHPSDEFYVRLLGEARERGPPAASGDVSMQFYDADGIAYTHTFSIDSMSLGDVSTG